MNAAPTLLQYEHLLAGLYQHQAAELLHLLSSTAHRALFWQMGVGKTYSITCATPTSLPR